MHENTLMTDLGLFDEKGAAVSMWSTALARVYPTIVGIFLPSLPSPEAKVVENLGFMGEGNG